MSEPKGNEVKGKLAVHLPSRRQCVWFGVKVEGEEQKAIIGIIEEVPITDIGVFEEESHAPQD